MPKNYGELLNEQLAQSPLVKETDSYMEQQVLNPTAPVVNVKPSESKQLSEPVGEKPKEKQTKYPMPFLTEAPGAPKHCQALVDAATYANMSLLKTLGVVPQNMSLGAMATEAVSEWVDKKIREWAKKQKQ